MPHPPDITILLAPAAAGKSEAALAWMAKPRRGRAILLIPSGYHRDRLAPRVYGVMRRASLGQPSRIVSLILRSAGAALPQASPTLRARLLRAELRRLAAAGRLPRLAPVAHKPGLAAELLALIDELQAADIAPHTLAAAAVGPYDADLDTIYAAYRAALARLGLADEAGRMARAIELLQADERLLANLALLVVDGFDQFSPLQLRLLQALCARANRAVITLTGGHAARPAQRRFARTLEALRASLPAARVALLPPAGGPAPPLAHAEAALFELADSAPALAGGAITLTRAPDREREVRAALRQARRLRDAGAAPEQIAVIFRSADPYAPLLREVAAEYGLPLAIAAGRPLIAAPPVAALLALLALPAESYPHRALVECWRNLGPHSPSLVGPGLPEIADFAQAAALLDRATRSSGQAAGLDRLRGLLQHYAEAPPPADDQQEGPLISPAQAAALHRLLDAFAAWLAPPAQARPAEYIAFINTLIDLPEVTIAAGDAQALPARRPQLFSYTPTQTERLRQLLAHIAEAARLLQEPPQPYGVFLAELEAAIGAATYDHQPPGPGFIAALDALSARGACFEHVLLIGLAEGEFPARMPAPGFYTRRERAALAARGLALAAADPADERTLFYEAVTRARASLYLSYTGLDESGNPLGPSPYLRDLLGRFGPGEIAERRIRAGSPPDLEAAASPRERLIALVAAGRPLDERDPLQAHVARACAVERARTGLGSYGPYEGIVQDPQLIAALAAHYGPRYRWSVTQINDYTICPFRFAAAHLLRLRPPGGPEEGLAQAGRGRLLHAILSRAGQRWAARRLPAAGDNEQLYQADLSAAAAEVLADAPQTYGFTPGPLWEWEQAELRGSLARALRRSLRAGDGWEQFIPAGTEESFGIGQGRPPLAIDTPAGPALIAGRIDRIDQAADGSLALTDYKSGSTPPPLRDTLSGRDVQLTVYSLASEQLISPSQPVARAAYLALGSGKRSRPLAPAERPQAEQALRASLGDAIAGARSGQFPVRPSQSCPPACAYAAICRLNLAKRETP